MFKYLCISIGFVTPTGDRNKYKLDISICTCISSVQLEVAIGRAGPTVGRAKTGPGQNWPGFFGPKF